MYHEYSFYLLIRFNRGLSVTELRNMLIEKFPLDIVDEVIEAMENRLVSMEIHLFYFFTFEKMQGNFMSF